MEPVNACHDEVHFYEKTFSAADRGSDQRVASSKRSSGHKRITSMGTHKLGGSPTLGGEGGLPGLHIEREGLSGYVDPLLNKWGKKISAHCQKGSEHIHLANYVPHKNYFLGVSNKPRRIRREYLVSIVKTGEHSRGVRKTWN